MDETLGELIVRLRASRGWTQDELARRAGLKQPTVADVERGRSKLPGPEIRRALADALNVGHLELLVAAGQITADEIPQEGAIREPFAPDDLRSVIVTMLEDIDPNRDLSADRLRSLQYLLNGWIQDARKGETQ